MPIDTSYPQQTGDVLTDENGDPYRVCYRDSDDSDEEGFVVEWRFYFAGRSSQNR
jgi:hypothetical protein